jgi:hypothetical protein
MPAGMTDLLPTGRVILDLCSGSGEWSRPYREAGYQVVTIDLPTDVRLLPFPGPVHGILAAPPCNRFALSGNRWPKTEDDYREALSVVDACLRLVAVCRPAWWALENPVGTLCRWLGPPALRFDPCEHGDPYTKRTCLWGSFTAPGRQPVEAALGSHMHGMPDSNGRAARRAITPPGFARAFFEANR